MFLKILIAFGICLVPVNCEFLSMFSTAVVSGAAAFMYAGYSGMKCNFYECCEEPWLKKDINALKKEFHAKLYGQHLASDLIIKHLQNHVSRKSSKALALSFHGWTGTGKNFVSNMIAQSLFKKGMQSEYVKLFICPHEFPYSDEHNVNLYKMKIKETIKNTVSKCGKSMFIFDEVDKAPSFLLDLVKPFLDYHEMIDGIDFRNSIFIFISNSGGKIIAKKMYDFWKEGKREEVTLKDLEETVKLDAYNQIGGMNKLDLIEKNLISSYVPFLPLERSHLKMCIKEEIKRRGRLPTDEMINQVVDLMEFFPENSQTFSKTGCKRVIEKVDLTIYDDF